MVFGVLASASCVAAYTHAAAGNWLSSAWKKAKDSVQKIIAPEEQTGTSEEQPEEEQALDYDARQLDYNDDPEAAVEANDVHDGNAPAHDGDYEPFNGGYGVWYRTRLLEAPTQLFVAG